MPDLSKSNTQKTQHHEACGHCYIDVWCNGQTEPPFEYPGPNAMEHFLPVLQMEEQKIKVVLANPEAMQMTRRTDWPVTWLRHTKYVKPKHRLTRALYTANVYK